MNIHPPRYIVWSTDTIDLRDPFQKSWLLRQTLMHGRAEDIGRRAHACRYQEGIESTGFAQGDRKSVAAIFGVFRCQKNNLPFKVIRRFSTFAEFLVERENESLKIDLALDSSDILRIVRERMRATVVDSLGTAQSLQSNHCENFP